jgi:hypothetical protein
MDKELVHLLDDSSDHANDALDHSVAIRLSLDVPSEIQVLAHGESKPYSLKPLDALYGQGSGAEFIDTQDEHFLPLLMAIEEAVVQHHRETRPLSDADVQFALNRLTMNPAADPGPDILAQRIQVNLRLCLSLNDYSKQEAKLAIRKILQSVNRHTKSAGPRGYISFIDDVMP